MSKINALKLTIIKYGLYFRQKYLKSGDMLIFSGVIMKFLSLQISISLFFFVFTNTVFAEKNTEIYKWLDNDGKVHYSSKPGSKSAKKMDVGSKRFINKETEPDNSRAAENKKERAQFCQDAKSTLKKYQSAPFLYRHDEERKQKVRLTEQETKEAFIQVEKDISYWCSEQKQQNNSAQDEDNNNNKDEDQN